MFVHVFVERNCLWSDGMQQHIDLCYNIYVLTAQFKSMHKPFKQDQNFDWHQHYITCTWQLQDKKKKPNGLLYKIYITRNWSFNIVIFQGAILLDVLPEFVHNKLMSNILLSARKRNLKKRERESKKD